MKSLRKTNKSDWRSRKKQIKAIEDYGEQLVESNKFTKKDFNIDRDSIPLKDKKKMFSELVKKRSSEFWKSEKKISLDNLTYE